MRAPLSFDIDPPEPTPVAHLEAAEAHLKAMEEHVSAARAAVEDAGFKGLVGDIDALADRLDDAQSAVGVQLGTYINEGKDI